MGEGFINVYLFAWGTGNHLLGHFTTRGSLENVEKYVTDSLLNAPTGVGRHIMGFACNKRQPKMVSYEGEVALLDPLTPEESIEICLAGRGGHEGMDSQINEILGKCNKYTPCKYPCEHPFG